MPCCVALLALISPRLAIIAMALFSDNLTNSMGNWFIPFIGFFVLPWTTLAYAGFWAMGTNTVSGFEWFLIILAFLIDLGSLFGGQRARTSRTTVVSTGGGSNY